MEGLDTPPMPSSASSFFSPLLISMLGIVVTSIAIIIYHLFLIKYCLRRHRRRTITNTATLTAAETTVAAFPLIGVDQKVLEQIKIFPFSTVKRDTDQPEECVVCLGELQDEDEVRVLPDCKHAFHVPCIDHWFAAHVTCPLCRFPIREQMSLEPYHLDSQSADDNSDPECSGESSASANSTRSWPRAQSFSSTPAPPSDDGRSVTPPRLKRSLSMDPPLAIMKLQKVDSSNSQTMRTLSGSYKFPSSRFDRQSSKWLRSFSCLRLGKQSNGTILPY